MTQFEFLTVAFSILLAVTVTRLVEGFVVELRELRKYWVHMLWIAQTLMASAGVWWSLWGFAALEWSYAIFVMVLIGPMLLFAQAVALVPREIEGVDWETHFYENARFYMLVSALTALYLTELSALVDNLPLKLQVGMGVMGVGSLAFAFISNKRAHEVYVLVNLVIAMVVVVPSLMNMG